MINREEQDKLLEEREKQELEERRKERRRIGRCGYFGGNIEEIPKPHIRMFSNKQRKRKVQVEFHNWVGNGGRHTYVSLTEEDNPIWNEKEYRWQKPWEDPEGKGQYFSNRFNTHEQAVRWAKKIAKKYFPNKTHKLVRKYSDNQKWWYKEGD
jgi:hypothetical protein